MSIEKYGKEEIKEITKIENPKSHLKKTVGRPLLKVWFTNKLGKEDSAAWWTRDLESWTNTLNNRIFNISRVLFIFL